MTPVAVQIKICGLRTVETVEAACDAGAHYIGLNLAPNSPRKVSVEEARQLAKSVGSAQEVVALFGDPEDSDLAEVSDFADIFQLHGHESPERVAEVKQRFGKPVIKAIAIARPEDIASAQDFEGFADILLFDAKPPTSELSAGGHGQSFDWHLLEGQQWDTPWMLAGGLNARNVGAAIAITGAAIVDVSSGVESTRGVKDVNLIKAFMAAVKAVNE